MLWVGLQIHIFFSDPDPDPDPADSKYIDLDQDPPPIKIEQNDISLFQKCGSRSGNGIVVHFLSVWVQWPPRVTLVPLLYRVWTTGDVNDARGGNRKCMSGFADVMATCFQWFPFPILDPHLMDFRSIIKKTLLIMYNYNRRNRIRTEDTSLNHR